MNVRRFLLVAVNLALVSGLAVALTPASETPNPSPTKAGVHSGVQPAADMIEASTSRVSASKPLFARVQAPAPVEPPKRPVPNAPAFRLAGVLWGDAERIAVVQLPNDAGNRRIRLGEIVDDWTLSDIKPKAATFSSAGRTVVLGLSASSRPVAEQ